MQVLANLKVAQKIYLVLALISVVAIAIGFLGLDGIRRSNDGLRTVYEDRVVPLRQLKVVADMYAVNIVDTCHKVRNGNLSWAEGIKNLDAAEKVIHEQWDAYRATKMNASEENLAKEAEPLFKKADASVAKIKEIMQKQDQQAMANYTVNELYPAIDPISAKIAELVELQLDIAKQEYDIAQYNYQQMRNVFIIALVGGIGLALVIAFSIIRMITIQLTTMVQSIDKDENGYITIKTFEVTTKDEFGQLGAALNILISQVRDFIRHATGSAAVLASSSEELTAGAEQSAQASSQVAAAITSVAQGAEKQANAVNTTAAVVEQMSAGVQQIAANANSVTGVADRAAAAAKLGGKAIEAAVLQMESIDKTVSASAQVVTKLGERSQEIGQIVDTIAGIAGQTNLLALNAAIEAARAGEQGRGFAVVAEEVRKLAEQSQEAAKQIASLIGEIQGETGRAVTAMNDGTREVKSGTEVVNSAGQSFREIMTLVTQVLAQVREISAAIQQMASGSQQIVVSVKDIERISKDTAGQTQTVSAATEEQAASMEEVAASSQALAKMADELQEAIKKFKI